MFNLRKFTFLLVSTLLIAACSFQPFFGQETVETNCDDWSVFKLGEYELHNNVWGKTNKDVFTQCIYSRQSQGMMGWRWDWPTANQHVKAYPSVLFGHKPWARYSTTNKLPLKLADVAALNVSYAVEEESDGMMNLLLEAWITQSAIPTAYNRTQELAIHMYQRDWPGQAGKFVESVVFSDVEYDFYYNEAMTVPGDNHSWAYLGFVQTGRPVLSADVDMKQFIDYLIQNNYVSPNEFIASVELGNEVAGGQGQTKMSHYQVNAKSK